MWWNSLRENIKGKKVFDPKTDIIMTLCFLIHDTELTCKNKEGSRKEKLCEKEEDQLARGDNRSRENVGGLNLKMMALSPLLILWQSNRDWMFPFLHHAVLIHVSPFPSLPPAEDTAQCYFWSTKVSCSSWKQQRKNNKETSVAFAVNRKCDTK